MSSNTGETVTHILHVNPEYTEHLQLSAVWFTLQSRAVSIRRASFNINEFILCPHIKFGCVQRLRQEILLTSIYCIHRFGISKRSTLCFFFMKDKLSVSV